MSFTSIYHSLWIKKLSMAVAITASGFALSHTWAASVDQPALPVNPDSVAQQVVAQVPSQADLMSEVQGARGQALGTVTTAQDAASMAQSIAQGKVADAQAQANAAVAQAKSTVDSAKSQVDSKVQDVQSQANGLVDQATGTVESLQGQVTDAIGSLPTAQQLTGQVTSLVPALPVSQDQVLSTANGSVPHVSGGATVNNSGAAPSYTINLSVSK